MRAMGFEPKREEVRRMIAESDREGTGTIDFATFESVMAPKMATRAPASSTLRTAQSSSCVAASRVTRKKPVL